MNVCQRSPLWAPRLLPSASSVSNIKIPYVFLWSRKIGAGEASNRLTLVHITVCILVAHSWRSPWMMIPEPSKRKRRPQGTMGKYVLCSMLLVNILSAPSVNITRWAFQTRADVSPHGCQVRTRKRKQQVAWYLLSNPAMIRYLEEGDCEELEWRWFWAPKPSRQGIHIIM